MKTRWWKRDKAEPEKPVVVPEIPPLTDDEYRERQIGHRLSILEAHKYQLDLQDEAERRFAALHPLLKPNTETKEN